MLASEAALWFADTALDGWNGSAWVSDISMGDWLTYDRFITERTFGAKKRLFLAHEENKFDPATYPVVRTPDGKQWVVVSDGVDMDEAPYAHTFLLLQAEFTIGVIELTTSTRISGQKGVLTETTVATYRGDYEQFSLDTSDVFRSVVYGIYRVVLPGTAILSENNELEIMGDRFEIQEISRELLTKVVRAVRRGPNA
jgi:hypothetical protein